MRKILILVAVLATAALLSGCSGGKAVTRMDTDTTVDLSGKWNDADSRQVAEALIQQSLTAGWYGEFRHDSGRRPILIVGPVRNKSSEHIPVKTFIADLERSMINSGKVTMVASAEEREAIRGERADQQEYASRETMASWGREMGADAMLLGEINTIIDQEDGDEVRFYQVDVFLVDLETNVKTWAGYEKIKKFVSRDGYRP